MESENKSYRLKFHRNSRGDTLCLLKKDDDTIYYGVARYLGRDQHIKRQGQKIAENRAVFAMHHEVAAYNNHVRRFGHLPNSKETLHRLVDAFNRKKFAYPFLSRQSFRKQIVKELPLIETSNCEYEFSTD